jgi:hypothetical protein
MRRFVGCRPEAIMTTHATDPKVTQTQPSRLSRISQRAHEIYEARGGQDGRDLDDWLQAEREIDAEIEAAAAKDGR